MKHSRTLPLLVEVGCEEIPARFLDEARDNFGESLLNALAESRLLPPAARPAPDGAGARPAQWYSTPRRLIAWVPEVVEKQPDKVEEILGPPVRVGLDGEGKPTRAAGSFAAKHQARVEDLARVATRKGEYLAVRKTLRGRPARELLREILPGVITGLSFPKSMYWEKSRLRFVRPIRWILALLGEGKYARVVPIRIAGVPSGCVTYGHRVLGKGALRVQGFEDYAKKLRQAGVEFDPEIRRERTRDDIKVLLEDSRLTPIEDKWLERWVVNSTEWPRALLGKFEEHFLRLPREILVTVMRDHQKYFALEDRKGNLKPRFIAVLNSDADKKGLIRQGHERVLAARFTDAEFFWNADQRRTLQDRQESLGRVTYEAELGSYGNKVRRMKALAREICTVLEAQGKLTASDTQHALRALELAKCDLTTQMVQEFPELQGIVGGLYARAQGEPREVCEAIYDQYLPQGMEDRSPRSVISSVVSLADKIDSVVAGFAVGHAPTGSSDPFAMRRQANGIIKVLLEVCVPIALKPIIQEGINNLEIEWRKPRQELFKEIVEFFEDRLRFYLETVRKLRYDTIRAILATGWDVPAEALRRAEALEKIRDSENFEALSVAAKRIKNILAKSATASDWQPGEVAEKVLKEEPERDLYRNYISVAKQTDTLCRAGEYERVLEVIASLRPAVDRFFDKVLVMAEDRATRENRLRLLGKLDELFSGIAQFAEIAAAPANVDASTSKTQ